MEHQLSKEEIIDKLYKSYGTDSGILFGITDKQVVIAIVDFVLTNLLQKVESIPTKEGVLSAEEVLDNHCSSLPAWSPNRKINVLKAMEIYASQFKPQPIEEDKLKAISELNKQIGFFQSAALSGENISDKYLIEFAEARKKAFDTLTQ